jgi:predicted nuclease with TOPRIM domain
MERKNTGKTGKNSMNYAVKEMAVAGMAIVAGDPDGTGRKILEQYQNEISGHLARYANALLTSCSEL